MARSRDPHGSLDEAADYAMAYLEWEAGERDRKPIARDYGLSFRRARREQLICAQVIEHAAWPLFPGEAPLPESFGVAEQRGGEIGREIHRLAQQAYNRKYA